MTALNTFELHHPLGVRIASTLTVPDLLSVVPAVVPTDMRNGWEWYPLPPFPDGEALVAISLGFNSGKLELITIADVNVKFGASWSDWSEEKERLRASSIGSWLKHRGISAGTYQWGSIWVGYNAKDNFGSAAVRFAA